MNPLLFIPSPRDIPAVKRWWHTLPYDRLIAKYKPQNTAYIEAKKFFLKNKQYTHLVILADDLEVQPHHLTTLLADSENHPTVSGYCNLAESNPDTYDLQPHADLTQDRPHTSHGMFYDKTTLPDKPYLTVEHCGSACRVISRELFEQIRFEGNSTGGWFDWGISQDLKKLDIPNMINLSVFMNHYRETQKPVIDENGGYTFLWTKSSQS